RPADLAERPRIVRVVAELRREIERDRETRLAVIEQVAIARVRLLRGGEARVLADRPRAAAVHVAIRAARERILARGLDVVADIGRRVARLQLEPRLGA